jgi:hypothetical protein
MYTFLFPSSAGARLFPCGSSCIPSPSKKIQLWCCLRLRKARSVKAARVSFSAGAAREKRGRMRLGFCSFGETLQERCLFLYTMRQFSVSCMFLGNGMLKGFKILGQSREYFGMVRNLLDSPPEDVGTTPCFCQDLGLFIPSQHIIHGSYRTPARSPSCEASNLSLSESMLRRKPLDNGNFQRKRQNHRVQDCLLWTGPLRENDQSRVYFQGIQQKRYSGDGFDQHQRGSNSLL